ncbi:unnamed protein product [Effrenium voratum]|nr:unnamed protein product [Effrenium voratum]
MERPHVVFMNVPATGHMNPTLALVRELRDKEVPVTYFVHETMREVVEANGAQWRAMQDPTELTDEQLARYVPEAQPEGKEFPCSLMVHAASSLPAILEALKGLQPPPSVLAPRLRGGAVSAGALSGHGDHHGPGGAGDASGGAAELGGEPRGPAGQRGDQGEVRDRRL